MKINLEDQEMKWKKYILDKLLLVCSQYAKKIFKMWMSARFYKYISEHLNM